MRELPSGTVTFLFTDVAGSTRLLQELGEEYATVLAEHRATLRASFGEHGGVEVDTQGDAFFVAFARARDAAAAALVAQERLQGGLVRVRMGLHTGEPLVTEEGYVGIDVHRAARIAACGHGGQVLVSQATRDLLDRFELYDLGEHRLKDLTRPERLFQLGGGEFPPLKSLNRVNLPVATTPLVGRVRELGQLCDLIRACRIVTLTGAGGIGKTRLALQVAAELAEEFSDGVHFVPLAGLQQANLVVPEISAAVGEAAPEQLSSLEALVLLDNMEHLLEAAPAVSALLASGERLKLLVTSRAPLRIEGEHEFAVDGLASEDAQQLFAARARSIGVDCGPSATVAAIADRLDRLPLALELAAARLRSLDAGHLLERLERRLPLLIAGRRDAPDRHRTLEAAIDWSYDLLDAEAQAALRAVAIFTGGFSLEAAETVAGATLEQLDELLEFSLLKSGGGRFLMLDTVREYALDRLDERGPREQLERRHAAFFTEVAEQCYARRFDPHAQSLRRLQADDDNLRAAIEFARRHDRAQFVRLAGALGWFYLSTARLREAREYLDDASAYHDGPPAFRARALAFAGALRIPTGDLEHARSLLEQAVQSWRSLDEPDEHATALMLLGSLHLVYRRHGDDSHAMEARRCFEHALELWSVLSTDHEVQAVNALCMLDIEEGHLDGAEERAQAALEQALSSADPIVEQMAVHYLGDIALLRSDYVAAERCYRRCLQLTWQEGASRQATAELLGYAMAIAGQARYADALRLAGVWKAFRTKAGIRGAPRYWQQLQDRDLGGARHALGPGRAEAASREGETTPLETAVQWVLADQPEQNAAASTNRWATRLPPGSAL